MWVRSQTMSLHDRGWAGDEGGREGTYVGEASMWPRRAPTWGGGITGSTACGEGGRDRKRNGVGV